MKKVSDSGLVPASIDMNTEGKREISIHILLYLLIGKRVTPSDLLAVFL